MSFWSFISWQDYLQFFIQLVVSTGCLYYSAIDRGDTTKFVKRFGWLVFFIMIIDSSMSVYSATQVKDNEVMLNCNPLSYNYSSSCPK
jgi:hypothetical protein